MAEAPSKRRLDSWKEIAAYLRRDQRTAQRWARERGLPVHHVPGPGRGRVFAWTEEIDAWLKQPELHSTLTNLEHPAAGLTERLWWTRRKTWAWLLLAVAAAATVLVLMVLPRFRGRAVATADHVTFEGRIVQARDARGRLLWEYELPAEHGAIVPSDLPTGKPTSWVADLDGDGGREVLALVGHADQQTPRGSLLYCWSGDGRLVWRYEPKETLRFAGRAFESPWVVRGLLLLPQGKATSVWLAVVHTPWWPAYVVRLNALGRAQMQFVNSGTISALNWLSAPGATYVLASGFNNEYDAGFLSVLSAEAPSGASPQGAESPYRCETCPPGNPLRYYVFPRTEVNRLQEHYTVNEAYEMTRTASGVLISTREVNGERVIYEFSFSAESELQPAVASLSDGFPQAHKRLEEMGRVNHPFEKCPDATRPRKARMWTPEKGWSDIEFPVPQLRTSTASSQR